DGLHPSAGPAMTVITGVPPLDDQVTVLDVVTELPQASVAVHVLVCDIAHVPETGLSEEVSVTVPQASLAVALPSAALIADEDGLHPSAGPAITVITGVPPLDDQVTVLDAVTVPPHASVAARVFS